MTIWSPIPEDWMSASIRDRHGDCRSLRSALTRSRDWIRRGRPGPHRALHELRGPAGDDMFLSGLDRALRDVRGVVSAMSRFFAQDIAHREQHQAKLSALKANRKANGGDGWLCRSGVSRAWIRDNVPHLWREDAIAELSIARAFCAVEPESILQDSMRLAGLLDVLFSEIELIQARRERDPIFLLAGAPGEIQGVRSEALNLIEFALGLFDMIPSTLVQRQWLDYDLERRCHGIPHSTQRPPPVANAPVPPYRELIRKRISYSIRSRVIDTVFPQPQPHAHQKDRRGVSLTAPGAS